VEETTSQYQVILRT